MPEAEDTVGSPNLIPEDVEEVYDTEIEPVIVEVIEYVTVRVPAKAPVVEEEEEVKPRKKQYGLTFLTGLFTLGILTYILLNLWNKMKVKRQAHAQVKAQEEAYTIQVGSVHLGSKDEHGPTPGDEKTQKTPFDDGFESRDGMKAVDNSEQHGLIGPSDEKMNEDDIKRDKMQRKIKISENLVDKDYTEGAIGVGPKKGKKKKKKITTKAGSAMNN